MEPERPKYALQAERHGERRHRLRLHHRGGQRLHHGLRRAAAQHQLLITLFDTFHTAPIIHANIY